MTEKRLLKTGYFIIHSSRKSFLKVVHRGKLTYYHWEYPDSESGTIDYIPLFHIAGRNEMVRVTQGILGLKREALSEYFNDCPGLVQKIERREIRTPEEVIDFYGNICKRADHYFKKPIICIFAVQPSELGYVHRIEICNRSLINLYQLQVNVFCDPG